MRRWITMLAVLALLAAVAGLSTLAAPTAASADPSGGAGCSGALCIGVSPYAQPATPTAGHVLIVFTLGQPGAHDPQSTVDGATFAVHNDDGLTLDPASISVSGPRYTQTVSGNDFSLTFSGSIDGGAEIRFNAAYDPTPGGELHSNGTLTFSGSGGGPQATSTGEASFATGPDIELGQLEIDVNPDPVDDDGVGYETDRIPHGYAGAAISNIENQGGSGVPAGAQLEITMTPGFELGSTPVIVDDAALSCSGSAPTWTCTLPALPVGVEDGVMVPVQAPADDPVGLPGSVTLTIPAGPIGDVNPDNNSVSHDVVAGPVAKLSVSIAVSPSPVPVGASATATVTFANAGPDAGPIINSDLTILSPDVTVTDGGGGTVETRAGDSYALIEFPSKDVPAGGSISFPVVFTVTGTDSGVQFQAGTNAEPSVVFTPCSSDASVSRFSCQGAVTSVDFVNSAQPQARGGGHPLLDVTTPTSTAPLAATGSDTASLAWLGMLLLVAGAALVAAGRPRRRYGRS